MTQGLGLRSVFWPTYFRGHYPPQNPIEMRWMEGELPEKRLLPGPIDAIIYAVGGNYDGTRVSTLIEQTQNVTTLQEWNVIVGQLKEISNTGTEARISNGYKVPVVNKVAGWYLDDSKSDTQDFLTASFFDYSTKENRLDQLLKKYNVENIYGPDLLSVMEEIGYSSRRMTRSLKFTASS